MPALSIRIESVCLTPSAYSEAMVRPRYGDWGSRFRLGLKAKKLTTGQVAEKMDLAESSVRSWLNGNREINLSDFFLLCDAAGLDPATVLFAGQVDPRFLEIGRVWAGADERGRELLMVAAEAARRFSEGTSGVEFIPPKR